MVLFNYWDSNEIIQNIFSLFSAFIDPKAGLKMPLISRVTPGSGLEPCLFCLITDAKLFLPHGV